MCVIVDASVAAEVFSSKNQVEAGKEIRHAGTEFRNWVTRRKGQIVVGGKLLKELHRTSAKQRLPEWIKAGWIVRVNGTKVDATEKELLNERENYGPGPNTCISNDAHVIALAQVSGARLLYSNDVKLHKDFKNKNLINNPPGKIYSTRESTKFTTGHENLLNLERGKLCGARRV